MSIQDATTTMQLQDDISIETLRGLYATSELSPEVVVRNVYSRISNYADKAVWITLVPEDEALRQAHSLVSAYPDKSSRPSLFGIPFSVKDSIDIAGMPTTLACPSFAYTATSTAPVVQRILSAGGILIGKTNLDQFATGLNGTRSPYGIPRSVHDPDYISGGSSSGSAVSVAAHLVSFSVATDTAGSTRVPAALNGVVGLKPTLGTISTVGLVPAVKTADCITIIAPTIATAAAALDVVQAYDHEDVYARDLAQLSLLASQPPLPTGDTHTQPIRYGLPPPDLLTTPTLSPAYAALFTRLLTQLPQLLHTPNGASRTFDYTPFAAANAMLYDSTIVTQRLVAFKSFLTSTHDAKDALSQLDPSVRAIFAASIDPPASAASAHEDLFTLAAHRRAAHRQFRLPFSYRAAAGNDGNDDNDDDDDGDDRGIDVLIVPSTTTHPTVRDMQADPLALNKRLGTFTHFVNLLDLCAVAVPVDGLTWRSDNGREMPFGVTLIGLPGRERELMALGRRVGRCCRS